MCAGCPRKLLSRLEENAKMTEQGAKILQEFRLRTIREEQTRAWQRQFQPRIFDPIVKSLMALFHTMETQVKLNHFYMGHTASGQPQLLALNQPHRDFDRCKSPICEGAKNQLNGVLASIFDLALTNDVPLVCPLPGVSLPLICSCSESWKKTGPYRGGNFKIPGTHHTGGCEMFDQVGGVGKPLAVDDFDKALGPGASDLMRDTFPDMFKEEGDASRDTKRPLNDISSVEDLFPDGVNYG